MARLKHSHAGRNNGGRIQAVRATPVELAYLSHWREQGYFIRAEDPVPCSLTTPPEQPRRFVARDLMVSAMVLTAVVIWPFAGK